MKKPPVNKDRSLRGKSGKKQGAQDGHNGVYLSVLADPNEVKHHMRSDCTNCPYHDSCLEKACVKETRYELDTDFTVNVIAHELVLVKDCPMHGGDKQGTFPKDIKATVQYGKNLQALVVALNTVGAVSYYYLHKFDKRYDEIIQQAYEENPLPESTSKKRGRKKKTKVLNLVGRLENYKESVCLFIKNLSVPFDNN